jgi:hypothetical protein
MSTSNGDLTDAKKLPWMPFFVGDWLRDSAVGSCSLAAQGLWVRMLCLMWEAPTRGYLQHGNGEPFTTAQLARVAGITTKKCVNLLRELESAGVFSRSTDHDQNREQNGVQNGIAFSRRMVRDECKRTLCSEAGRRGGGNPTFKGGPKGQDKGGPKGQDKGGPKGQDKGGGKGRAKVTPKPSEVHKFRGSDSGGSTPYSPHTPLAGGGGVRSAGGFAEFWSAYPKHVKQAAAEKVWAKLRPDKKLRRQILDAIERWKESDQWTREGGRYVPEPAKWLRGRCWTDELPEDDTADPDVVPCRPMDPAAAEEFMKAAYADHPNHHGGRS